MVKYLDEIGKILVYVDETSVNEDVHKSYGWSHRGEYKHVPKLQRRKSIHLLLASTKSEIVHFKMLHHPIRTNDF